MLCKWNAPGGIRYALAAGSITLGRDAASIPPGIAAAHAEARLRDARHLQHALALHPCSEFPLRRLGNVQVLPAPAMLLMRAMTAALPWALVRGTRALMKMVVTQLCQCWLHNQGRTCETFLSRKDCSTPKEGHTGRLGELVMPICRRLRIVSLTLDKAPSWHVHGPFLRHICLRIPPSTKVGRWYGETYAEHIYEVTEMSGVHSKNLPQLQTTFLQGLREPVQLRGMNFRTSTTLEVRDVQDCWIDDLSVPPFCRLSVSAQSEFMIGHMDKSREHPLVSKVTHVCLPTDLGEWIEDGNRSGHSYEHHTRRLRGKYAMGIADMFPAMRSLRMTWPKGGSRCIYSRSANCNLHCFSREARKASGYASMKVYHIGALSRHWQHVNLKELLIEGDNLGITIPALPNLEKLLVFCKGSVALDFVDASSLGRTITRMSVTGKYIHFPKEHREALCMALKARDLKLDGDWMKCIAVQGCNDPVYPAEQLLRQAMQELACQCKACPSCLGIGERMLNEDDPSNMLIGCT